MQKIKSTLKRLWADESGHGATEYILLLVIVVAVAFLFKGRIKEILTAKLDALSGDISGFTRDAE
jgi:Flp pilus assembly pilin Flp